MKRLMAIAAISLSALLAHAQDVKTVLDNRANGYKQDLARIDADVKKQQEAWPDQYLQALNILSQKFSKEGDLDKVLLVRQEIDRFKQTKQAPDATVQEPRELASLQAKAIKMPQTIEANRHKQIAAANARLVEGLEELKKRFTQQGQIDDALKVNEEIGLVKKKAATDPIQAASPDSAVAAASPVEKKPDPLPEPVVEVKPVMADTTQAKEPVVQPPPAAQPPKRGNSPIGKWSTHPPDMPEIGLTMTLHEDGRFDQDLENQAWGGTFKFLNDEHTRLERNCRNGSVFIIEYDPVTDKMMQNDGAPYVRVAE